MTETMVQGDVCSNCGIKTRDEAEYCYNCGSKIARPDEVLKQASKLPVSSDGGFLDLPAGEPWADRIPMPEISLESDPAVNEKPAVVNKPMRTASSLRRDRTRHLAKPKEVVWVEREGPGLSFIISSIIIVIITLVILVGAIYLK
ncbi:hypothetical protein BH24ACI3_BH24ACI3_00430 [soil metagenome]